MTLEAPAPRGRILGSVYHDPAMHAGPAAHSQAGLALIMVFVLIMFGQTFQYVIDVWPLYALSKVWPLFALPLALLGAVRLRVPGRIAFLLLILWMYVVTPTISVLELGNTFLAAAATTIKVWSLTYVFGLAAVLFWLKPSEELLYKAFLGIGAFTFVSMTLLYLIAPQSLYEQGIEQTKLFLWDVERGRRIYAPMFFGLSTIFLLNRSFWLQPRIWKIAALVACFLVLLLVYKQRTSIAAAGLCVLLGAVYSLPRGKGLVTVFLGAMAVWAAFILVNLITEDVTAGLGGSLSVRQMEFLAAVNYLSAEPWRWITGVGSITRSVGGTNALAQIVGARVFFLHDLGWLGVIFEYGLIGVVLLLLVHGYAAYVTGRGITAPTPLPRALFDYVLYILITSLVYSITFAPGEVMTCMAIAYYLHDQRRRASTKPADPDTTSYEPAPLPARARRRPLPSVVS